MDLGTADTYLVFTIRARRFAVPLPSVAGVTTLTAAEATGLRDNGVLAWQGFYCPRLDVPGLAALPAAGDTAVILETAAGRRVLTCAPKTTSRRLGKRWPVPRPLAALHPAVREAAWEGGDIVHCLDVDREAA